MSETSVGADDRWITLDGSDNTRELGGLPTTDGGRIRRRRLIRAGTLQDLSPAAVSRLVDDIGIRTVIDLRLEAEAQREGSALAGINAVTYLALPLTTRRPPHEAEHAPDDDRAEVIEDARSKDILDHYRGYLDAGQATITAAARTMADLDSLPLVFHCAAGKDRTGVLAAIVLDAVRVEREAVVADYALSAERADRIRDHLIELETYREMRAVLDNNPRAMSAEPETMRQLLAVLDEGFGGGAGYLRHCGLSERELESLRASLVEY